MNSNKNIEDRLKSILKIKNKNEKYQIITEMIHLNIMNEINNLMEQKFINKTQLAEKLNVSKSYITQLFTADKILNLRLLAQIQDVFNISFGMTLFGEYMAVVPLKEQPFIKNLAEKENISIKDYVQNLLDMSITFQRNVNEVQSKLFSAAPPSFGEYQQNRTISSFLSVLPSAIDQKRELYHA